jgi:hypothetical protein
MLIARTAEATSNLNDSGTRPIIYFTFGKKRPRCNPLFDPTYHRVLNSQVRKKKKNKYITDGGMMKSCMLVHVVIFLLLLFGPNQNLRIFSLCESEAAVLYLAFGEEHAGAGAHLAPDVLAGHVVRHHRPPHLLLPLLTPAPSGGDTHEYKTYLSESFFL